jgi:hypothetical protein
VSESYKSREEAIAAVAEEAAGRRFMVVIHQADCQGFGDDDKCTCTPEVALTGASS